jgi:hypothetical protein
MAGLASEMLSGLRMHEEIFRYWKSLKKPGRLPSRSDFDPSQIRKQLPTVSLIDIIDLNPTNRPECFRQRLAGTDLYQAYGVEITGRLFSDIYTPDEALYWAEELSLVVSSKKPNVGLHSLAWRGAKGLSLFWLRLPMASDGFNVDMILGHDAIIGRIDTHTPSGIRAA